MKRDDEHKAVKSKEVKEEEVARIPIAFAMIKLMQTLPPHIMEANLPGYPRLFYFFALFASMCPLLKGSMRLLLFAVQDPDQGVRGPEKPIPGGSRSCQGNAGEDPRDAGLPLPAVPAERDAGYPHERLPGLN